jgi:multisubunit Na+/H+ antiporter MnhF subunit
MFYIHLFLVLFNYALLISVLLLLSGRDISFSAIVLDTVSVYCSTALNKLCVMNGYC